jgi:predicted permease
MLFVALAVVLATAAGVLSERRTPRARTAAHGALQLMLYVLVPFVSFVNIAHLDLTVGAGTGLLVAYVAIASCGVIAWFVGRRVMHLRRPSLGAVILTTIVVNTGYLGLPMSAVLLGTAHLGSAIVYDQLVSGPTLFLAGFAIGAAFGDRAGTSRRERARAFVTRNPPLIAVVLGLLAPASLAPAALVHASHFVIAALLPLGFFAVGVNLSSERRADDAPLLERPDRRVTLSLALRLLVTPTVLASVSGLGVPIPTAYILQGAMPTGITSLLVGHAYGLDQRLIATVIVWSTMATLAVGLVVAAL